MTMLFLFFLKKLVRKTSYLWMAMRKVNSKRCPSRVVGGRQGRGWRGREWGELKAHASFAVWFLALSARRPLAKPNNLPALSHEVETGQSMRMFWITAFGTTYVRTCRPSLIVATNAAPEASYKTQQHLTERSSHGSGLPSGQIDQVITWC